MFFLLFCCRLRGFCLLVGDGVSPHMNMKEATEERIVKITIIRRACYKPDIIPNVSHIKLSHSTPTTYF